MSASLISSLGVDVRRSLSYIESVENAVDTLVKARLSTAFSLKSSDAIASLIREVSV
ncbi:MAG: hypothetical protein IPK98_19695 [Chloracidobacterium sp.]|nr:hypothetical protein [Chloracidobacterium sp.]